MFRSWLVLAALSCGAARGVAPFYTADSIVNAANYAAGPFAPNSIVTIFGVGMARSSQALSADDIRGGSLPTELNYVRVYVQDWPAPMFYVSDGQINFLMPSVLAPGKVTIRVVREGVSGPEVTVTVAEVAPALFQTAAGYAIATHADNSVITPDAPAHSGEIIVVYASGLGKTQPSLVSGEIAQYAAQIQRLADLKVSLGGSMVDPARIKYAGLTPGSAGLYQINLLLPDTLPDDPEIRVAIGDPSSPPGAKLAAR